MEFWRRCNCETFEAGGSEIEKNEFGDSRSWNGDGLALRLDKLENGIKVKREECERKKRGGEWISKYRDSDEFEV